MKQIKRFVALCFCSVILLTSCTKFGTAVSTIKIIDYQDKELTVEAVIDDRGGCRYYIEQGFCYRQDTFPNLNDLFTTKVKVNGYSEADTFLATFSLPSDTTYWVCAYVKNSAGLSYSNAKKLIPANYHGTNE